MFRYKSYKDLYKRHTNFPEVFKKFKNLTIYIPYNNESIILQLEEVYKFFFELKEKTERELEEQNNKLRLFVFRKAKIMIQIFKIFEIMTDIVSFIIEYHKNFCPYYQRKKYYSLLEKASQIIIFRKNYEKALFKRDPYLEEIKLFENIDINNSQRLQNTILKTFENDF